MSSMRIAVVHDYFNQGGGADKVAEELYCMIPGADLVATVALKETIPLRLRNVAIRTSWMQRLPLMRRLYRFYFFLYPFAVESLEFKAYDLVISSSSGYAKGVNTPTGTIHICYCHNPMRWVWEYEDYMARQSLNVVQRLLLPSIIHALRKWDVAAAKRPDHFVTNSQYSANRIEAIYGRHCTVIPPPIDTERFSISNDVSDYYLVLARLVSYRRIDTAVAACTQLGRRLCVIGGGPDLNRLKRIAGPTITFLGSLTDAEVNHHISRCRALLFPGIEDFGMVVIEAAAAGRPTIAFRAGGALETIIDGQTGLFYDQQTADHLADAIQRFEAGSWDARILRRHALSFSSHIFRERFSAFLKTLGISIEVNV